MRGGIVLAAACLAAAVAAVPASATNECHGLKVCVPVAGPWVLAPAGAEVEFQLACPKKYVVGGLDAELSTPGIEVDFRGALGAPVNPGITTSSSAVFLGRLLRGSNPAASFRPHIGCIPSAGGGQRVPVAFKVFAPSKSAPPQLTQISVRAGTRRYVEKCPAGEQVAGSSDAVGFYTKAPPGRALVGGIQVTRSVLAGRVHLLVRAGAPAAAAHAVVQVDLVCVRSA
jgi:hypothetical protein